MDFNLTLTEIEAIASLAIRLGVTILVFVVGRSLVVQAAAGTEDPYDGCMDNDACVEEEPMTEEEWDEVQAQVAEMEDAHLGGDTLDMWNEAAEAYEAGEISEDEARALVDDAYGEPL